MLISLVNNHRKVIRLELHITDDSSAQLQQEIEDLKRQLINTRSQLDDINFRSGIDIRDLKRAQTELKSLGGSPQLIKRISSIISRLSD